MKDHIGIFLFLMKVKEGTMEQGRQRSVLSIHLMAGIQPKILYAISGNRRNFSHIFSRRTSNFEVGDTHLRQGVSATNHSIKLNSHSDNYLVITVAPP
jgi:hypothetical protein